MKRRLFNQSLLRRRSSCGKRCVTISSSANRTAAKVGGSSSTITFSTSAKKTIRKEAFAQPSSYSFYGAITAAFGTAVAFDTALLPTSRSSCDAPQKPDANSIATIASETEDSAPPEDDIPFLATRPLWPDGVSEEDVDALVEIILEDPSINIQLVPDAVEAIVYKSAVRLVLNLLYRLLNDLNGVPLLSHQIQVARLLDEEEEENDNGLTRSWFSNSSESVKKKKKKYRRIAEAAAMMRSGVNDEVLDTVAARLLQNHAVNNAYIPDVVEIYLYQSCLKVVFRTLQILSHTFSINLCGHDICLMIKPSVLEQSALTAASSISTTNTLDGKPRPKSKSMDSEIDQKMLVDFALKSGNGDDDYFRDENISWWDRFWLRRRRTMIANLHSSLYALILGIADDLLQHSNIKLLSDDIFLDITPGGAPSGNQTSEALPADKTSKDENNKSGHETSPTRSSSPFSFLAGMGIGAGLIFLLSGTR